MLIAGLIYQPVTVAHADPALPVIEYPLPVSHAGPTGAAGLALGADGNVWVADQFQQTLDKVTPNGTITTFAVACGGPQRVVAGPDGNIWFTDPGCSELGSVTPSGNITLYPVTLPSGAGSINGITVGADGNLWFTIGSSFCTGSCNNASGVGRMTTAGQALIFPLSNSAADADAITLGPDGNVWFGERGSSKLGEIDPSGHILEYAVAGVPGAITVGSDGRVWYGEYPSSGAEGIAAFLPTLGEHFYALSSTASHGVNDITLGADGRVWFADGPAGDLGAIDPSGTITEYGLPPSSAGARNPAAISPGPGQTLWYTDNGAMAVGLTTLGVASNGELSGVGLPVQQRTGGSFTAPVAAFSDTDSAAIPADFTATVTWGDGSSSAATVAVDSASRFVVSGTHTYIGPGNFVVSATIAKTGAGSITTYTRAHIVTHFHLETKAWIPQPYVVDPLSTIQPEPYLVAGALEPNCLATSDPLGTLVYTRFSGDNHTGYSGGYRSDVSMDFDWDGTSLQAVTTSQGTGVSHRVKIYYDLPTGQTGWCMASEQAPPGSNTGFRVSANTFRLSIGGASGRNPFISIAPPIRADITGSIKPDGTLTLAYSTTEFPSIGLQVVRNGGTTETDVVNDVSCLSNDDVLGVHGALLVGGGLFAQRNSGTLTVGSTSGTQTIAQPSVQCTSNAILHLLGGSTQRPQAKPRSTQLAPTHVAWPDPANLQTHAVSAALSGGGRKPGVGSASNTPTGGIGGTVTGTTGAPLAGICIAAVPTFNADPVAATGPTDSTGAYIISGVAPGAYDIRFEECAAGAHVTQWSNGSSTQAGASAVNVNSSVVSGVNARMSVGGTITGTVQAQGGAPLAGICVRAADDGGRLADSLPSASTGAYSVGGLAPGVYRVFFADCAGGDHLAQYYPGSISEPGATLVTVTGTGTVTGINATIVGGGEIAGTVTDTSGRAIAGSCVSALDSTTGTAGGPAATTDANGAYTLHGLAAGGYGVQFSDCGGTGHLSAWYGLQPPQGPTLVAVTAGTVTTGINAQLLAGGSISGHARVQGGTPLAGICATATSIGGSPITVTSAQSDSTGLYTIIGLPTGTYAVDLGDCTGGDHIAQWYSGQPSEALAAHVAVTAGAVTSAVDATFIPGGLITGTVTSSGTPVASLCVTVDDLTQNPMATAVTGTDGRYSVGGLRPGAYKVEFADCLAPTHVAQWYRNAATFAAAKAVTVVASATTSHVDASLVGTGTISGAVTDAAGTPLAAICVQATTSTGSPSTTAATASDGTYTLSSLAPATYSLFISACNAASGSHTALTVAGVKVTAGTTTSAATAKLTTAGGITGVVTDAGGVPVQGACVSVQSSVAKQPAAPGAVTDGSGSYVIASLPAGVYTVVFSDCTTGTHVGASVSKVVVAAGKTTSGVGARLSLGGGISGVVTDAASQAALPGMCVDAYPQNNSQPAGSARTASDGSYTITLLSAGTYQVAFSDCAGGAHVSQWGGGATEQSAAPTLTVTSGNVTAGGTTSMAFLPSASVSGAVVVRPASGVASASFRLKLSNASTTPVLLTIATMDGSAVAARGDYVALAPTTVLFAAGQTARTVSVSVLPSAFHGSDGTFTIALSSPVNATIAVPVGTATIVNPQGLFSAYAPNTSVSQPPTGTATASVTVSLTSTPVVGETVTMLAATVDGTAKAADGDYVPLSGKTLTFDSTTGPSVTVPITVNADPAAEGNETFGLALSSPSSNALLAEPMATITVVNSGSMPGPTISAIDTSAVVPLQGMASVPVQLNLSSIQQAPVTANWSTQDGTATHNGGDYTSVSQSPVTFAPGVTSQTVSVTVNADFRHYATAAFSVVLSQANGASIEVGAATVTLVNPLGPLVVHTGPVLVTQNAVGQTQATVPLITSVPLLSAETASLTVSTQDGSATVADGDYVAVAGSAATFAPGGQSVTVTVTVLPDPTVESVEAWAVLLSGPSPNLVLGDAQSAITVLPSGAGP